MPMINRRLILRGVVLPLGFAVLVAIFLHYQRANNPAVLTLEKAIYASDVVRQEVGAVRGVCLKPSGNMISEHDSEGHAKLNVFVVGDSRKAVVSAEMRKISGVWGLERGTVLSRDGRPVSFVPNRE